MGRRIQSGKPVLNLKVPLSLRMRLEAACERERRTLTNEAIIRLERSFAQDEARDEESLAKAS